ncbi:MAG: phosphoglycerate mutase family protein [Candidatus Dojkabacteria bacterium]
MKQVILTRHTNNRVKKDAQVRLNDYELTSIGKEQALEVKNYLSDKDFEVIYTSLYLRTVQTAEIINEDKKSKTIKTNSFNEYFLRPDGSGVESTDMGISRTMTKLFSIFDIFEKILIVAHSSINQTIIHSLLNIQYKKSLKYFNDFGETHILRYDYKQGDSNWRIVDSFKPKQK